MFKDYFFKILVELCLPKYFAKQLAKFTKSGSSRHLIPAFCKHYKINMDECRETSYPNLHSFFTRQLKEGVREISPEPMAFVSPCDGLLADFGKISSEKELLIKGQKYKLSDFFANNFDKFKCEKKISPLDIEDAKELLNPGDGHFLLIYLSPQDYHRFHSPIEAKILDVKNLGNKSYPVNERSLSLYNKVLARNHRIIIKMNTTSQNMAYFFIPIGALNVNSIILRPQTKITDYTFKKGEELGYFSFGSSILLLFSENTVPSEKASRLKNHVGKKLRLGEKLFNLPS